jgi:hypothetical protein
MATPTELLSDMPAVHAALVSRYTWFIHAAPDVYIEGIRKHGLLPNRDAARPQYTIDAGITGKLLCLYPLGASRQAPPAASTLTLPMGQDPNFVTFAVIDENLPRRVGIDWSFERAEVEKFMVDNPHLTVGEAALAIAHEYGSVVSYTEILPDKLRVFCHGDPPTNPFGWRMLTQVSDDQIARQK